MIAFQYFRLVAVGAWLIVLTLQRIVLERRQPFSKLCGDLHISTSFGAYVV